MIALTPPRPPLQVREHLISVMGPATLQQFSNVAVKMSKFQMAQVYAGGWRRMGFGGGAGAGVSACHHMTIAAPHHPHRSHHPHDAHIAHISLGGHSKGLDSRTLLCTMRGFTADQQPSSSATTQERWPLPQLWS